MINIICIMIGIFIGFGCGYWCCADEFQKQIDHCTFLLHELMEDRNRRENDKSNE